MNRRPCDLVMKGGVTSGVVYPAAVYEISRIFDIRSIGGTSAGAIAAAVTAAAQYRRVRDNGKPTAEAGYDRVKAIPTWLSQDHRLFRLFKPNQATRALFRTLIGIAAPGRSPFSRATAILWAYPVFAAIGCLPGLAIAFAALNIHIFWLRAMVWFLSILVLVLGAVAAAAGDFVAHILRKLPRNQYGLVTGVDDGPNPSPDVLCTWLTSELEMIAGLDQGVVPLTFGMLWSPSSAAAPNRIEDPPPVAERTINLQMVTTSVTEGRPYQFPTRTERYYFKGDEMRKFFPDHVVKWMEDHAQVAEKPFAGFTPMPPIGDLPIIVATRMSLAFPFLLSAVPLHAVDYTAATEAQVPQPVWFSDGGLTSNFPIAMFDSPIPEWPTLAINLGSFGPRTDPSGIIITKTNAQGRLDPFNAISSFLSFLSAIFGTMQNWNDNVQAKLPGFRDRIVTVALRPDEGGLNLDMDPKTIEALESRGVAAGRAVAQRFAVPSDLTNRSTEPSWESHRWSRLRTDLGMLKEYLGRFSTAYLSPVEPDVTYRSMIVASNPDSIPRRLYRIIGDDAVREHVAGVTDSISELGGTLSKEQDLEGNLPRPSPSIVTRPNLD